MDTDETVMAHVAHVGIDAEKLHANEGKQNGEGEHSGDQRGAAQMQQHDHDDNYGDENLLAHRILERAGARS